jgi:aminoglycoside phosphotransferase (APT) family kinase protein
LLWHAQVEPWLLLAFEYIEGRPATLTPGSLDLDLVADAVCDIGGVRCPDLPVLPVEKRWAPFADPERLNYLRGDTLVHADLTAENFLISAGGPRVVDWGWPSVGAPWLDTATLVVRLIQSGHEPRQAETWAERIPAWRDAPREGIQAYAEVRAAVAERNSSDIYRSWAVYLTWLAGA